MDPVPSSASTDPRVEVSVAERSFTLTRWFDAPRERMWRAWTDPRELAAWCPPAAPLRLVVTVTFEERDGAVSGWSESLERLESLVSAA